ncbi:hypothetical protein [Edaphobacter acidisoli]|nr:hypothetical protein [Edaphobacter acidisoli]
MTQVQTKPERARVILLPPLSCPYCGRFVHLFDDHRCPDAVTSKKAA